MSKLQLKIFIWLGLLGLIALLAYTAVTQTAQLLRYFQQGADPASALNIVPNKPPDLEVALAWLPDDPDTGREMEPLTRVEIESAYLRAWLQWNISYLRGEAYGLETYFVGPALEAVEASIDAMHAQGWSLQQTDLEHHLHLHFYSADGSIVSFTARDVLVAQVLRSEGTIPVVTEVTRADYEVVMMLEDGNWRVRHWVRTTGETLQSVAPADPETADFVTTKGDQLVSNGRPFIVRGLNYYPKDTPWHDFWPTYDPHTIEEDFALIESLGLNTIRIFVPYNFQLPEEEHNTENSPTKPADPYVDLRLKLADLLARAESHNLKVIVTLFDFRTDYQILLWPNANRDIREIVPYFADSPTILAWDLKNEPDLDQAGNTPEMVNLWLEHVAWQIRQHDPNHLLTIGWAAAAQADQLTEIVDFISFHDYLDTATFSGRIAKLRQAAPNKPIVLTEFGLTTWNSYFFPIGNSEQEQAVYYADMIQTMRNQNISGYVAWTLHDFSDIPADVVGRLPWRTAPQHHFGLVDSRGNKKPAAFLLAPNASLEVLPPSWIARIFQPFWQTVYFLIIVTIIGFVRLKRQLDAVQSA